MHERVLYSDIKHNFNNESCCIRSFMTESTTSAIFHFEVEHVFKPQWSVKAVASILTPITK